MLLRYYFLVDLELPDTTSCNSLFLGNPEISDVSSSVLVCVCVCLCVCVFEIIDTVKRV